MAQTGSSGFDTGDWCWHIRQAAPCRVVERLALWGDAAYRVWLPGKGAVLRARAAELAPLASVQPTVEQLLHATAAAKLRQLLPAFAAHLRSKGWDVQHIRVYVLPQNR